MSNGTMYVRFPDGEIKLGTYYGTSDTIGQTLWSKSEYKFKEEKSNTEYSKDQLLLEDVCVVPLYGGDWHFYTQASRKFMRPAVSDDFSGGIRYMHKEIKGLPDWYLAIQEGSDPWYETKGARSE